MAMAEVIDIRTRRPASAAPAQQEEHRRTLAPPPPYVSKFYEPTPTRTSRRNRYDSAFKGYMTKRARELCWTLRDALSRAPYTDAAGRDERIQWVIAEIEAIKEQVLRETPEHFPTAGA